MWSRPRLVKAPAASLTPSSRRWSRPWLEASIAACVTPSSASSAQQPVQRDRIGRGQRAIFVAAGRDDAGRADAGRRLAVLLPDLPGEGGDRGLAAVPVTATMVSGCLPKKRAAVERQRQPRVGDFDDRHRDAGTAWRRSPRRWQRRRAWRRRRQRPRHRPSSRRARRTGSPARPRASPMKRRRRQCCRRRRLIDRQNTGKIPRVSSSSSRDG